MKLRVTVNGVDYEVEVEILDQPEGGVVLPAAQPTPPRPPVAPVVPPMHVAAPAAAPGAKVLNSPIPGTIVELKTTVGQAVSHNETVLIIDAMKMNTPIGAPVAGKVKEILVQAGDSVKMGQALMTFE